MKELTTEEMMGVEGGACFESHTLNDYTCVGNKMIIYTPNFTILDYEITAIYIPEGDIKIPSTIYTYNGKLHSGIIKDKKIISDIVKVNKKAKRLELEVKTKIDKIRILYKITTGSNPGSTVLTTAVVYEWK